MKTRLKFEFLTLELIDKRRKAEHRPYIGLNVEQRIIARHLRELEELAQAGSPKTLLSKNHTGL